VVPLNAGLLEVLLVAGWLVAAVGLGLVVWRIALGFGRPSGRSVIAGLAAGVLTLIAGAVVIVLAGVAAGS
jgi:hypothetical protein